MSKIPPTKASILRTGSRAKDKKNEDHQRKTGSIADKKDEGIKHPKEGTKDKKEEVPKGGGHGGINLFDFLPRALNTRRRYSAFRPVPLPHQGQPGTTLSYTSITASELANIELMEKGNLADHSHDAQNPPIVSPPIQKDSHPHHSPGSDLDQFLNGLRNKIRHDDDKVKHAVEEEDAPSVKSSWMSPIFQRCMQILPGGIVVVLGLLTLAHAIAFIAFFASSDKPIPLSRQIEQCFVRHGNLSFCTNLHNASILLANEKPRVPHPLKDTG